MVNDDRLLKKYFYKNESLCMYVCVSSAILKNILNFKLDKICGGATDSHMKNSMVHQKSFALHPEEGHILRIVIKSDGTTADVSGNVKHSMAKHNVCCVKITFSDLSAPVTEKQGKIFCNKTATIIILFGLSEQSTVLTNLKQKFINIYMKSFNRNEIDECVNYLEIKQAQNMVLITSHVLVEKILMRVCKLSHVISVYLLNPNMSSNNVIQNNSFVKVYNIDDENELVNVLNNDLKLESFKSTFTSSKVLTLSIPQDTINNVFEALGEISGIYTYTLITFTWKLINPQIVLKNYLTKLVKDETSVKCQFNTDVRIESLQIIYQTKVEGIVLVSFDDKLNKINIEVIEAKVKIPIFDLDIAKLLPSISLPGPLNMIPEKLDIPMPDNTIKQLYGYPSQFKLTIEDSNLIVSCKVEVSDKPLLSDQKK
ncbi:unnamed protein product [Didymodactylos carnosus]|uniref:Uncharacterized protein n=2 Tax=Didymodactylos carnosus TaxID=1234261 RepID=A0A814R440_9BILA|nr:unnamed protein product [Didymodactylos carnosus]CAF3892025.1 unnamed protein product [Didymodactylos carnosus]